MTLRIGVLGASRIAGLAIVDPAQELGHRLVAIGARDPRRAQLFAEKYGVERALGSYREVLDHPDVDNCTEAQRVSTAARTAGVPVVEAFHYGYHPVARRLLELITRGDLCELE